VTDVIFCVMIGRPTDTELGVFIVVVLSAVAGYGVVSGLWAFGAESDLGGLSSAGFSSLLGFVAFEWYRFLRSPVGAPVSSSMVAVVLIMAAYLFLLGSFCSLSAIAGTEGNHLVYPDWVWLGFPTVGVAVLLLISMVRTVNAKRAPPGPR
jgi:hypothetical protein